MNYYEVTFNGSWLGGKAIVKAINKVAAKNLIKDKTRRIFSEQVAEDYLKDLKASEIDNREHILYYDEGEY